MNVKKEGVLECKFSFLLSSVNMSALGLRVGKPVELTLDWFQPEQMPMMTADAASAPEKPADNDPPATNAIRATCYDKTGKCHDHGVGLAGPHFHCVERPGLDLMEACEHMKTDANPGEEAEGGEVEYLWACEDCGGLGQTMVDGPDETTAIVDCQTCEGSGKVKKSVVATLDDPLLDETAECPGCNGSGKGDPMGDGMFAPCETCSGEGTVIVERLVGPEDEPVGEPLEIVPGEIISAVDVLQATIEATLEVTEGVPDLTVDEVFTEAGKCNWSGYAKAGYCVDSDVVHAPCKHVLAAVEEAKGKVPTEVTAAPAGRQKRQAKAKVAEVPTIVDEDPLGVATSPAESDDIPF